MCKVILLMLTMLFLQSTGMAEIFKYKGDNGRWEFTDVPKKGANAIAIRPKRSPSNGQVSNDFVTLLNSKFQSDNPVQQATLAVVTVKSSLGSGSGFFVTDNCYLVTNKHVVRPAKGRQWEEANAKMQSTAIVFEKNRLRIQKEKKRIAINKQKLNEYRKYVQGFSSDKQVQQKYDNYARIYEQESAQLHKVERKFDEDERKFNKQRSDFNFSSSISDVAQTFDITLKDNTKAKAHLVKVSTSDDLAILKINRCMAPYLTLASGGLSQGVAVHAIGSPLGLGDQLTQGTVTQVSSLGIASDAQILPGNSGGPLITSNGHVVAVNTLKVAKGSALNVGFGFSIPVSKVRQNFSSYLR